MVHSDVKNVSVPGQLVAVSVGQWAIIKGSWRDEIGEVSRVSDKQVRTFRMNRDREAHHRPEEIVFAGTEKQARDLLSVLKGLDDRHERNRQQLIAQHRATRAAAILKATTEPQAGLSGDEGEAGVDQIPTRDGEKA